MQDNEMRATTVSGSTPSGMDCEIETRRLGLGAYQRAWFIDGVFGAAGFPVAPATSDSMKKWQSEGRAWAEKFALSHNAERG